MVEFFDKPAVEGDVQAPSSDTPDAIKLKHAISIPGYTILLKLGERATSTVWQARQESLNRLVAIKVLKNQYSDNQQEVDKFINEAKAVAKLKNPNIIQIYDIGSYKETFYFVMEYVEGQTLNHLLKTERYLPQQKALTIAAAVANALEEAWSKDKIVHRDINPENIMLENDGSIKVLNLGLAGIMLKHSAASSGIDETSGTPNYMSPEQLSGIKRVDYRSDMYSLGATLYHMVTGQIPFAGKDRAEIIEAQKTSHICNPLDIKPNITTGCVQIITRLMMENGEVRFKNWSTVYRDLTKLSEGKIVVTKIAGSAKSMIAGSGKVAPPVKVARPLVVASNKSGGASSKRIKELKNKYSKKRAPRWLSIPLELIMLAWFGWLVYQLILLPMNLDIPQRLKNILKPKEEMVSETIADDVDVIPDAPQIIDKEQPNIPTQPLISDPKVNTPEPVADSKPNKRIRSRKTPRVVHLSELKRKIVGMLLKGQNSGIDSMVRESYPNENSDTQVTELLNLLSSPNLSGNAVANAFESNIGKRISIMYRGIRKNIIVNSVSGETISATIITSTGVSEKLKPTKFKTSQLDPQEQSRQVGDPSSPDLAVAKYLLHMNAGDYINARSLAEKCGPLSDACIAEVDAKIKMIME